MLGVWVAGPEPERAQGGLWEPGHRDWPGVRTDPSDRGEVPEDQPGVWPDDAAQHAQQQGELT